MRAALLVLMIICVKPAIAQEQSVPDWNFKSAKAQTALKKCQSARKKIDDAYALQKESELDVLRNNLANVLKSETQAGNLEEAVKIKAAVVAIAEKKAEPPMPGEKSKELTKLKIPKDAVKFSNKHYKLITTSATWEEAKKQCEEAGGHLMRIDSTQKHTLAVKLMATAQDVAWIDGSNASGEWLFSDGKAMTYFSWMPGYPNDSGPAINITQARDKYQLANAPASQKHLFICEWDK